MADLRESLTINATAELVYGLVADLPRMGEWSPECERVTWRGGATRAAEGAQFIGHNKADLALGSRLRINQQGMVETLANLRQAAEAATKHGAPSGC